jgi:hypothetical protein
MYLDDCLNDRERAIVEEHLAQCPLCRQKLDDFQSLRQSLRVLPRPELPSDLLKSMRSRVAQQVEIGQQKPSFVFSENFTEWLQMRLMPYSVGTALSLLFGLSLLWMMLSAVNFREKNVELAKYEPVAKSSVMMANANLQIPGKEFDLSALDYAATRVSVSGDSPSLNPQGALVALTRSIVRGKMKDDEVVVVADVFGDGLAQIAEVVEPSSDRQAVRELEKALKNDPNFAPFVPATFDKRSDTVRVILKINRVDIQTHTK